MKIYRVITRENVALLKNLKKCQKVSLFFFYRRALESCVKTFGMTV